MIGVTQGRFCVQHSSVDNDPPYMVAAGSKTRSDAAIAFMMQGEWTEIPAHLTVTKEDAISIAIHFMETGERWMNLTWEAM